MRIAFIALRGVPLSDGIVRVADPIASELSKRGHEVVVYTTRNYGNRSGLYNGYTIKALHIPKLGFLEKMLLTGVATFKSLGKGFDVYHFEAMGPSAFAAIPFLFHKRVVIQSHGIEYARPKWGRFAKKMLRFLEKISVNKCQCLTVVSKKLERYFLSEYNKQTLYIPNFTDYPSTIEDYSTMEQFGLEPNDFYLFLNRIDAGKGVHYLINAFNKLKTSKKLAICGPISAKDPYHNHLLSLAKDNPNIVFAGFVKGAAKDTLYRNAYVCCQSSESEGMSTSLLEMMSFGKPCLISDIEENRDVAQNNAIYFRSADEESLLEALQYSEDHPVEIAKLGELVRQEWEKNYTLDKVADQYEEMYRGLVNGKNR